MQVLTDADRKALHVENFIFHAVHHGVPAPGLFDAVPIGIFEPFFLARVIETLQGNRYEFAPNSETMAALRGVEADATTFVETSKELARRFHKDDGRFKKGVLIVTTLRTGARRLHSLIKLDFEDDIITFDVNNATAVLKAVTRPLGPSPKALQKSALIELSPGGGSLMVVDHGKRADITQFFQGFLDVRRKFSAAEMTGAVTKAVIRTIQVHSDALPVEITARAKPLISEVAEKDSKFESPKFCQAVFGIHGTAAVQATFDEALAQQGIAGEVFDFDKASLPNDGGARRYVTKERVTINVPEGAHDTVVIEHDKKKGVSTVTIRSAKVVER